MNVGRVRKVRRTLAVHPSPRTPAKMIPEE